MNTLRILIIAFLANLPRNKSEQFNKAFDLYRQSPEKNTYIERRLNQAGFTEDGLKNLLYDLQNLHQIKDVEIKNYKPVELLTEETKVLTMYPTDDEISDEEKEQTYKIREQYSFLNDEDCPEELLIVVGKKISAWKRYQQYHSEIQKKVAENANPDDYSELTAKSLEAYEQNQSLEKELMHYAEKKEILGQDACLVEYKMKKEVDVMTNDELVKYMNSSSKFFSENKKKLEKEDISPEDTSKLSKKIAEREYKLQLVKNKLGVNG